MARQRVMEMLPGEELDYAKSLAHGLDAAEVLTGTPVVSVWSKTTPTTYTDVTASLSFTVAGEAVNTATRTTEDDEVIGIGKGVDFRLTATETPGTYEVRVECDGDDGSHPASVLPLVVSGPGTPA
jgi:hypothetical protein